MVNSRKLKGRMAEKGITQRYISVKMELAMPTVSQKINNVRPMSLDEAFKLAEILGIEDNEFHNFFQHNFA